MQQLDQSTGAARMGRELSVILDQEELGNSVAAE